MGPPAELPPRLQRQKDPEGSQTTGCPKIIFCQEDRRSVRIFKFLLRFEGLAEIPGGNQPGFRLRKISVQICLQKPSLFPLCDLQRHFMFTYHSRLFP